MTKIRRPKMFYAIDFRRVQIAFVCALLGVAACSERVAPTTTTPPALSREEQVTRAEERELARLRNEDAEAEAMPTPPVPPTPVPLVAQPDELIALHDTAPIWINLNTKQVIMVGRVVFREGLLELFACRRRSKEHESIVAIDVTPHLIHAALLAIGADAGKPASFEPQFTPATGDAIAVNLIWNDENGQQQTASASDWITTRRSANLDTDVDVNTVVSTDAPPVTWVFAGSLTYTDDDGLIHYVADETGEVIGLSNFAGAILDVPLESSSSNESLLFAPKTDAIPPLGTEITITLSADQ